MTVTFYNESGQAIKNGTKSDIKANYIGDLTSANPGVSGSSTSVEDAVGSWFKVNIPKGAVSFEAKYSGSPNKTTVKGDIYEKRNKTSSYRNDYTLGDMQYRILNTQTGGKYDLERFYPLFNESETYTLEVSDSKTIDSSAGITLVDEEEVEPYIDAAVATPVVTENGTTDSLVLHATSSNTITYTWQETTGVPSSSMNIKFLNNIGWSEVWIHYYGGSSTDTNVQMTKGTQNGDGYYEWYYSVPTGTDNIQFHSGQNVWNGANQTGSYSVSNNNIGNNSRFLPNEITGFPIIVDISDINNGNGQYHVQFTNSTTNATYSKNNITWIEGHYAGGVSPDDQVKAQWFEVPSGYDRMQLRFGDTDRKTNKLYQ